MKQQRSFDIGYFSSADRGLDLLCDMIPKVEEKLGRKVTSCWAYGWNIFDKFHKTNAERMKWKWEVIRKMNAVGMESKGRLSHEDLAKLMEDTNVWAYPTHFEEIDCITAKKAQAARCKVVTTGYAALQESIWYDEKEVEDILTNDKAKEEFVDRLVKALQEPRDEKALEEHAKKIITEYDWSNIARQWSEALK